MATVNRLEELGKMLIEVATNDRVLQRREDEECEWFDNDIDSYSPVAWQYRLKPLTTYYRAYNHEEHHHLLVQDERFLPPAAADAIHIVDFEIDEDGTKRFSE